MTKAFLVLPALILPALASAQQAPPAPAPSPAEAAPELPRPAPELQKLAFLVGDWVHTETYQASSLGPAGKGAGRSRNAFVLGDHHLYVIYASNTPLGKIESRGFLGWDPDRKVYRLDWFDNLGRAVRFTGDFGPDGVLTLAGEYVHQGQKLREQVSIKKQDDGQVVMKTDMAAGEGALKPTAESLAAPAKK